jgi:acyl-coenzyme A thioesterase PaaI-like protein
VTAPLLAGDALAGRAALVLSVPLQAALGTRLLDPADPPAGVVFEVGELADGGAGGAHAGALAVGLEVAALLVVLPHLTTAEHAVSVSTATTLSAQAPAGRPVEFRGTVDRRTGRTAFASVVAVCDGTVVARAQIVKSVVRVPGPADQSS